MSPISRSGRRRRDIFNGNGVVRPDMAQIHHPRRPEDALQRHIDCRFAVGLHVFGEVDVRPGVQQHLDLAGLPEAGAAMVGRQFELEVDRRRAERILANRD